MRYEHGAGGPRNRECGRPDCPAEAIRWPLRYATGKLRTAGHDVAADVLATIADSADLFGPVALFAPEHEPDDDTEDYAAAARAAIERL